MCNVFLEDLIRMTVFTECPDNKARKRKKCERNNNGLPWDFGKLQQMSYAYISYSHTEFGFIV